MRAKRLREMLSEATPGPWEVLGKGPLVKRGTGEPLYAGKADARLIALAPDAIALLADMADHLKWLSDGASHELLLRLDALCGDER